jgi:DNA-binding NtrC family response regulator
MAYIEFILKKVNGNKTQAAHYLGLSRQALHTKMKKIQSKS